MQTQGVFNAAKKLTEKLRKKGMVTRKEQAGAAGAGASAGADEGGGDSDYEIREDGVQLTETDVVRRKTGTWATVTTEENAVEGGGKK